MNHALISTATEQDIAALNQLVNSAYRGDSSRKGWTTEADLLGGIRTDEEGLKTMLLNPAATVLKYEEDNQLLGCVYLERKDTGTKYSDLYLGMLTVSPDAQAKGIGRKLLEAAEQLAVKQQCRVVTMTVITIRHELIAWYQRRGYQPTGEMKPFPTDPRFGHPRQQLEFMVMEKRMPSQNI
ncbi:GNAT family N-acetyltransferase [Spirosoma endbachense]|uniref:GNAT family N-acetyltransferase n=1 Tax=Spirosoma endbachense TaxID=2666025 RepID=A0A6P1VYD5_9BACT|nr:GNAT family N-acetyltransferase [Spirosoma endbachense]QHV96810.1 GNAT family N-acetyltransferase [Spirosoma endbachense]